MENLQDTGIRLKQLSVSDWNTLIENLNYNFSILLSSPLFKGMPGREGLPGPSTNGERGSRWFWAIWDDFRVAYNLTNPNQVNLAFINGQLASDLAKLCDTLKTDSIISNDNIVLPDGSIITFDITLGKFKDAGMSFAQAQGVTEQRVNQMINDAIAGINEGSIIYEVFKAYAKNFPDATTSGNNNQVNPDSIIDIGSPLSKPGYLLDKHRFVALSTSNMNSMDDATTFIFGAAEMYHNLIQKTQNGAGKTTNEYGPGVNDSTALAVLQDNYKNGIIIGYKGANTLRDFARIYRDLNALRLTSNYSVYENEFSEIIIREDVIKLRTKDMSQTSEVQVESNFKVIGKARFMSDILHTAFEVLTAQNVTNIGIHQSLMPVGQTYKIDFKETPTFSTIPNMTFLSTDALGKVRGSGYTVTGVVNGSSTSTQIPTALAVMNALNGFNQNIANQIATINNSINVLNNNVGNLQRDALQFRNSVAIPSDASPNGIYRLAAGTSPNNQPGYVLNLVDTSTSTKAQFAVTTTDILFRASTSSINSVAWITLAKKTDLDNVNAALTARLNGHDVDISNLSSLVSGNYTTLDNKINTVNTNLTNKINSDIANTVTMLRTETVQAIQGISVSGGLIKSNVGNSINIAHPTFGTTVQQEANPSRIITSISTNNGHVTDVKWTPFTSTGELVYGMVIDLIAFYTPPGYWNWWNDSGSMNFHRAIVGQYFELNGRGKVNAQAMISGGTIKEFDLSKFVLCDGRNGTPNLTGLVLIGQGYSKALDSYGYRVDPGFYISGDALIPHTPNTGSHEYGLPIYGLSTKRLSIAEMPAHDHQVTFMEPYQEREGGGTKTRYVQASSKTKTTTSTGNGNRFSILPTSFSTFKLMYTG
ncbi:gp266 [Sphingomonas phage PAU]|uniref:gp266 n=1 Tax=Sphingomonas phage PAU TaxID=1150991 RepID=UPI0002573410|nr:gp266 [Sphingomonas phage PAU]AFF28264.1 gp266 [Sphingomonas phage PAU]